MTCLVIGSGTGFIVRSSVLTGSFGNTSIGYSTLQNNTYGDSNTVVGWGSMTNNVTGSQNTALGNQCLSACTTGSLNMAFGRFTLNALTSGSTNMGLGTSSLRYITTQNGNVGVGSSAGSFFGANFESNNRLLACENSIFIGSSSRAANASGDNNCIVIGADTVGLGVNTTVIGTGATTTTRLRGNTVTGIVYTPAAAPTIASATTIAPTTPIVFISGTTTIATITPPVPTTSPVTTAYGMQITLIPTGAFTTTTAGNIALASTAVVSRALTMTYDSATNKWYPSY